MQGVYRIDGPNNCIYVGSSIDITQRWRQHLADLRNNHHGNIKLQRAFNKYGEGKFKFTVIELVEDTTKILYYEQIWLDILFTSLDRSQIYNLNPTAGSFLGYRHTKETKDRIRKHRTGKLFSRHSKDMCAINQTNGRKYVAFSPDGERHEFYSAATFALENNLSPNPFYKMLLGIENRKHHKGWTGYALNGEDK